MGPSKRPVRIAGCSGSAMDRRDALSFLASHCATDPVDVIIGDWMSEANMTTRAVGKIDNPDVPAYEPSFIESLTPALPALAKHGIKLAVNAGASDTKKLYDVVESMVKEHKLNLKVAWIEGDEVMPLVKKALDAGDSEFLNLYTGEKLREWNFEPVYAQAYLGGLGIAAAFGNGADIVLCGRVSDASPIIGAAAWWHGWNRSQLDCLANALVTGHLIECSSYVTGGNFTGFTRFESKGWTNIGYPIAEIDSNGESIITKSKGTGGEMSVDTCTSQLLYEIQGPWYFNSDVTAVLNDLYFEQVGPDRVALKGVKPSPPPPTTKVGVTARGGYKAEVFWFLVGLDIPAKARMIETQVRHLLRDYINNFSHLSFSLLGSALPNAAAQSSSTVTLRIAAQALNSSDISVSKFARPATDSVMCTYPGATPHLDLRMAFPRPIYEYYVTLIPQSELSHIVHLPFASNTITVPPPTETHTYGAQPTTTTSTDAAPPLPRTKGGITDAAAGWAELPAASGRHVLRETFGAWGRTIQGPLGLIAHARSGDKGPDANVGFFISSELTTSAPSVAKASVADEAYVWLRSLLTTRRLKTLLGEEYKPGNEIERFEMPGCRAVHFLLRNHLDRGVSATSSVDFLGKNVAEFLRARWVDLPVKFLKEEQKALLKLEKGRARTRL